MDSADMVNSNNLPLKHGAGVVAHSCHLGAQEVEMGRAEGHLKLCREFEANPG